MGQEDSDYIDRILRENDATAYTFLVQKYKDKVYQLSIKILKNEADAEESAQDTFVKAFKALKKFKRESKFSTWLYRIAYNTALTRATRRKNNLDSLDNSHEVIAYQELNAIGQLAVEDRNKYMNEAIKELNEEDQTIVHLFYNEEKDTKEIGEILNISHGNIRVKLSRLRNKLYKILEFKLKDELKSIA